MAINTAERTGLGEKFGQRLNRCGSVCCRHTGGFVQNHVADASAAFYFLHLDLLSRFGVVPAVDTNDVIQFQVPAALRTASSGLGEIQLDLVEQLAYTVFRQLGGRGAGGGPSLRRFRQLDGRATGGALYDLAGQLAGGLKRLAARAGNGQRRPS